MGRLVSGTLEQTQDLRMDFAGNARVELPQFGVGQQQLVDVVFLKVFGLLQQGATFAQKWHWLNPFERAEHIDLQRAEKPCVEANNMVRVQTVRVKFEYLNLAALQLAR